MRVITGSARGKRLAVLEGEAVRPTTDRVKEALFNIIQFQIEGRRVLDLFAGSGQLGIEALSRGASEAVFVDCAKESIAVITDYASYLARRDGTFDLVFLDPPYRTGLLEKALPLVAARMNGGGTIVCEHPVDEELPEIAGDFEKQRSYRYGKIYLTVYHRKDVTQE